MIEEKEEAKKTDEFESEFVQFDEEEIKDIQEKGDATIETVDIRKYTLNHSTFIRPRCKCAKKKGSPYCSSVEHWLRNIAKRTGIKFNYAEAEALYVSCLDSKLTKEEDTVYAKCVDQITKDLDRTFPGQKHFKRTIAGTTGITQLKNLLRAMSKRNPNIGYVQGMNFVMGALFFHSSEAVAFWLFDILMRKYGMSTVYEAGLIGLHLHGKIIDMIIEAKYPAIWEKMVSGLVHNKIDKKRVMFALLLHRLGDEFICFYD